MRKVLSFILITVLFVGSIVISPLEVCAELDPEPAFFLPTDDAEINNLSAAAKGTNYNYGSINTEIGDIGEMYTRKVSTAGSHIVYMKFDISEINISEVNDAIVRIYAKNSRTNTDYLNVYAVEDTSWTETTITWNNAPETDFSAYTPISTFQVDAQRQKNIYRYYEIDVKDYILDQYNDGKTYITLAFQPMSQYAYITIQSKDLVGGLNDGPTPPCLIINQDTIPPSPPQNLNAEAVSSSVINLSWTAGTDNVGVTGYRIYRDGTEIGTSITTNYSDTSCIAETTYSYTVSAYDAAGNESDQCSAVSITTPAEPLIQKTDHIEQFGVTWYFDKEYEYGQFANGDYWVIGPVNVIRITPEATENPAMNGSMINPVLSSLQGYDDRAPKAEYKPELNVALGISSSNPLVIQPGSSLISSISKPSTEVRPNVQSASVLTVLSERPVDGSFRPPYTGTDKSIKYNINQLNYQLLQNLPPTPSIPSVSSVIAYFERPWIDHASSGYMAQYINPDLNIGGYGARISEKTSLGLLMANTDIPTEQKKQLVIHMVQAGMDLYALYMDRATSRWAGAGGHNSGRLGLILFAGMMLQDEGMMNIHGAFQETDQTYYGTGWSGATVLWRGRNLPEFEYEEKHPSEWTVDGRGEPGDPPADSNSDKRFEDYRQTCNAHTWVGTALAFRLMNGMAVWNHPAYFDYIDRWMTENWSSYAEIIKEETGDTYYRYYQGSASHPFIQEMWNRYRDNALFVSVYPKSGLYTQLVEVQLYCEDAAARIYYTLDGAEPTESSQLFTSGLIMNQNCILKTKAFSGDIESPVCEAEYQIVDQSPPEIDNIYYDPDLCKVYVCFNERISEQGLGLSSFSLSPGGSIIDVDLQEDKKTVILETTPLDISQDYILSFSGIEDLMLPANILESESREIKKHEIFEDDFEDGTDLNWQYRHPVKWTFQQDQGDTSLRLISSSYDPDSTARKPGEYVILEDEDFLDFVLTLDGKLTDPVSDNFSDFCVIFGYRNNDDYYLITFSRTRDEAGIYKVVGKSKWLLFSLAPITADNNYHNVEVSVIDNMITVFVDGVFQGIIQNRVQNGGIGFGTMNDPAMFDNVRIKRLNIR